MNIARKMEILWLSVCMFCLASAASSSVDESPVDTTAKIGATVLLTCSVDAVAAAAGVTAQWAKDMELLGTDRGIRQYSRYRMVGNDTTRHFDLRITDVQLEDDGVFTCQLVFRPNNRRQLLAATLHVIVPPRAVTLRPSGRDGSVVEVKDGTQHRLECRASASRPAVAIVWLRDGLRVDGGRVETVPTEGESKLVDTISTLAWNVTRADDRNTFTCLAEHAAGASLTTNTTFRVMYASRTPVISGYRASEMVAESTTLHLQCSTSNGSPTPDVYWYRDGRRVDTSFETSKEFTTNDLTLVVNRTHNGALFECRAETRLFPEVVSNLKLRVKFTPTSAVVDGAQETRAGAPLRLTCHSSACNPQCKVQWTVDGRLVNDFTQRHSLANGAHGGYLTASNVSIDVGAGRQTDLHVVCSVVNDQMKGLPIHAEHKVAVLYAPSDIVIFGDEGTAGGVEEGSQYTLTCSVPGGNPMANVSWFKGLLKQSTGVTYSVSGQTSTAQLSLPVTRHQHGAVYRCEADSPALDTPLMINSSSLNVYFMPTSIRVAAPARPLVANGHEAVLKCESSSANPAPRIVWRRNGQVLGEGVRVRSTVGEHGGQRVVNHLALVLSPDDNEALYTCTAESRHWASNPSHSLELNVGFAPTFAQDTVIVREGADMTPVDVDASANPSNMDYKWYDCNGTMLAPRQWYNGLVSVDGAVLTIKDARRENAGMYTCQASNRHGASNLTVVVQVNYAPTARMQRPVVNVVSGGSGALHCRVDGMPLPNRSIEWYRRRLFTSPSVVEEHRMEMSEANMTRDGEGSTMTLPFVDERTAGEYECRVSNELGEANATGFLVTNMPPRLHRLPELAKAAAMIGEEGTLVCRASAVPAGRWAWFVTDDESPMRIAINDSKYSVSTRQLDPLTHESRLTVTNVNTRDYAQLYTCKVENNDSRQDSKDIRLIQKQQPDSPSNVRVVDSAATSVTLQWTRGFDGGSPQTFSLVYKPTEGDHEAAALDVGDSTRASVNGLEEGVEYVVYVRARNRYGSSGNSTTGAVTFTPSAAGVTTSHTSPSGTALPLHLIALICLVAFLALCVNCCLIICFVRRHKKKKLKEKAAVVRGRYMNTAVDTHVTTHNGKTMMMYAQDEQASYRPYSQLSDPDDHSIRTMIEVDSNGQPLAYDRISPGTHHTYLVDDHNIVANYAHMLRAHPMQQQQQYDPRYDDECDYPPSATLTRRVSPGTPTVLANGRALSGQPTASPALSTFRQHRQPQFEYTGDLV